MWKFVCTKIHSDINMGSITFAKWEEGLESSLVGY